MKVLLKIGVGLLLVISPLVFAEKSKVIVPMVKNAWGNLYKFHQSRAHYRSGKTYMTWVGPNNHPYVSDYDHKRNHWNHQRVGTNLISQKDYHGNPSILIDQKGFLHDFLWRPQQAHAIQ